MNYQIYGDKLTVYLENNGIEQQNVKKILNENEIEWIVVDCEKISEISSDILDFLLECSSGTAEVIAINANPTVSNMLMMCFIDVSLGFNYIPDVNNMKLILNGKFFDTKFINDKIFEFLAEREIEDDEEMSLHKKIMKAFEDVLKTEIEFEYQELEIECAVFAYKVVVDIANKSTGDCTRVTDVIF